MIDDRVFSELYHPVLIPRTVLKAAQGRLSKTFKHAVGVPFQNFLLYMWLKSYPASGIIERFGLPRYGAENRYKDNLTIKASPESLERMAVFKSRHHRRRMANRFIWDGDWDMGKTLFRDTDRYLRISDIWENRLDLRKSRRYAELTEMIRCGRPYIEYNRNRMGIYLNTEGKVLRYLEIYLEFMKQLETHGYESSLEKDPVCAAVGRNGELIKTAKGLHRLAMAQVLGMRSIPVRIRGVHREWWERTAGKENDTDKKILRALEHLG
ncbi:hypothetical protein EP073_05835 [Geovibrio thiophilus]|uniref:Uncharacterized protein n=1 Tax=Geovibrio thiophilus TaxID=139438 RepID=A0A3R5UYJ2_9BACT|nr:hypothetical protein [Geovibrio thiophilus]QAR32943.1 hypothetical protein EP073_05835 [Geovibrio thiophilus]